MKLLNLGCGNKYHSDWINIDFVSYSPDVIEHNLRLGIPFEANSFDVVYHSHVLEHFPKNEAPGFITECYRVLKPGGVIRIVVPDLEVIIKEYLDKLGKALSGDKSGIQDYEWILIELFDQMTRNYSGGLMAEYFCQKEISNEEYVYKRIGQEGKDLHGQYINSLKNNHLSKSKSNSTGRPMNIIDSVKNFLMKTIFRKEFKLLVQQTDALKLGTFRLSGEIHQWMYDRYSIGLLLKNTKFKEIQVRTAQTSYIEDWSKYMLDTLPDGYVRKPDSLFIEAIK